MQTGSWLKQLADMEGTIWIAYLLYWTFLRISFVRSMVFVYSFQHYSPSNNIDGDKKSTLRPPVTKNLFKCNISGDLCYKVKLTWQWKEKFHKGNCNKQLFRVLSIRVIFMLMYSAGVSIMDVSCNFFLSSQYSPLNLSLIMRA